MPVNIVYWPYFHRLQGRMYWLDQAFPNARSVDFKDFNAEYDGAIVVVNGAADPELLSMSVLSGQLQLYKWVVLILIGDEGSHLRVDLIDHQRLSVWVYDPKPGKNSRFNKLSAGPIQQCAEFLPNFHTEVQEKSLDWSFSGSIRDIIWDQNIRELSGNGRYYPHHLGYHDYIQHLASSKVVPCRPSWTSPETCRVYDALEAGAIPIVGIYPGENPPGHYWWRTFGYDWDNFWLNLLGEVPPFPIIRRPDALQDTVHQTLRDWPENGRHVYDWWTQYKKQVVTSLQNEVQKFQ